MYDNFSVKKHLHSNKFLKLLDSKTGFTGQTIIVTGANSGLGLEAARHFVRLDATKVIMAVRDRAKGQAALQSIEESTGRTGVAEVWDLDLASYASVEQFASKVSSELDRVNVVISNAGVSAFQGISKVADDEYHITINVVSTLMLAILLLPKLRETASTLGHATILTFTGSWMHTLVSDFSEQDAPNIFEALSGYKDGQKVPKRYEVSKLVQLLLVRELADQVTSSEQGDQTVIVSSFNPGAVTTNIARDPGVLLQAMVKVAQKLTCRTTAEGALTLVHAAEGGPETHGQYLDDCQIGGTSHFVTSAKGHQVQKKLWTELCAKLEGIHPGIMRDLQHAGSRL